MAVALPMTPPLVAVDSGLPEQIGQGQKLRLVLFFFLVQAIEPGSR